jgi:hypothetical protein
MKSVRQLGHEGFRSCIEPTIRSRRCVGQLAIDEHLRNDADHLAAGCQGRIGQHPIRPTLPPP